MQRITTRWPCASPSASSSWRTTFGLAVVAASVSLLLSGAGKLSVDAALVERSAR